MIKILNEAKRLHGLGLAIHWLRPKSKIPTESGWTRGERKNLKQLQRSYSLGYNIGIRLGQASFLGDSYLAVIDVDVKSTEPKHLKEVEEKLIELFGEQVKDFPTVASGRGNGSRHIYVATKSLVTPRRLVQSNQKVKVYMPSIFKASKYEETVLSKEEINKGIRIRPAWEICLMGEGQQVACPPSVHPDSGKAYTWTKPLSHTGELTIIDVESIQCSKVESKISDKKIEQDFKFVDVDLMSARISCDIADLIMSGSGCEDRSAALMTASRELYKAGMTDIEVLSVLTDRNYFLGETGYDHAKTTSRKRAAQWVERFTTRKAKSQTDLTLVFSEEVENVELKNDEAINKQLKELVTDVERINWKMLIERTGAESKPKISFKNMLLIMKHAVGDCFTYNEFTGRELYRTNTPWGGKRGREIRDIDLINMKSWFAHKWRFEPAIDKVNEVVTAIAHRNKFHPVREYINNLESWDGVSRIDTWMKDYLNAKALEPYLSDVSRKILVAMIARVFEPGKKFDYVAILEGNQGELKSTSLRVLAGDEWFTDEAIDVTNKDTVLTMTGKWILELGELEGMRKAEVESLKQFVSRQVDRIRLPYGKRTEEFPRQGVFIGTTNRDQFLKDDTGNRRFWTVSVGLCNPYGLKKVRDQLFAEALVAYQLGEALYLDNKDSQAGSVKEQEKRYVRDPFQDIIENFFEKNESKPESEKFNTNVVNLLELFEPFGPLASYKPNIIEYRRAGIALRKIGYEKKQVWVGDTCKNVKRWVKIETEK